MRMPREMTRDALLGKLAVALTALCVLAVAVTALAVAKPSIGAAIGLTRDDGLGYAIGDRIDLPSDLLGGGVHTVLIFAHGFVRSLDSVRTAEA